MPSCLQQPLHSDPNGILQPNIPPRHAGRPVRHRACLSSSRALPVTAAPAVQDRSCQCLLAMLSDDPSLQRQRAAAEPAGIAVLVRDGHVVVASVAAGSHVISLGGSPKLQPCKWTHVAVTFEGLTFGTAGNVGVTTSQVRRRTPPHTLAWCSAPSAQIRLMLDVHADARHFSADRIVSCNR